MDSLMDMDTCDDDSGDFDFLMSLRQPRETPKDEYKSSLPLVGIDGNAYSIMATVARGLRRAGAPKEYVDDVMAQMQSDDYDHLLRVAMRYSE